MQLDRGTLREGQLVRWNQQKGFGFIRQSDGGKDVFAHITSLAGQDIPQIGSTWVFSAEADPNGRGLRVVKAVPATDQAGRHPSRTAKVPRHRGEPQRARPAAQQRSASHGTHRASERPQRRPKNATARRDQTLVPLTFGWQTWLVASATLFCLAAPATTFRMTGWALLIYPIMSLIVYLMYAHDKLIALRGGWRIPESTLHLAELIGGWPGAYVAQQTMRHKTVKTSYQTTYWAIVVLHIAGWGLLLVHPQVLLDMLGR